MCQALPSYNKSLPIPNRAGGIVEIDNSQENPITRNTSSFLPFIFEVVQYPLSFLLFRPFIITGYPT
jgi:hypothetical protein